MSYPKDKHRLKFATASRFLAYDSKTGELRWREARRYAVKAGDVAGHVARGDGYRTIFIQGYAYKAHRLAWLLHTGKWPQEELDHINRNKDDNRIVNLREVTKAQNKLNSNLYRNNKSGYRGVHFHKASNRWVAGSTRDGKSYRLGSFATAKEASDKFMENYNAAV